VLQVSLWSRILTLIILLGGILIAFPNALPPDVRARMPKFLPSSAVNLGLDLQGGSYLLLGVDFDQVTRDRAETLVGDIRASFRKARTPFTDLNAHDDTVSVKVTDPSRLDEARTLLQGVNPAMTSSVLSVGGKEYEMTEGAGGVFTLRMTDAFKTLTRQQVMDQSIEVVRRRIDELGTREPTIERSGEDRILVQVPGLQDPTRLKEILGKTAKMEFRMVDLSVPPDQAQRGAVPADSEVLPSADPSNPQPYVIKKQVLVSGGDLIDAQPGFDQRTNQPIVSFKFNSSGSRKFALATTEHVKEPFAIVLDNKVISAPVIQEPITAGSGQISGSFTVQQANDLAILLRAGALPAPLTIIEERTVGPGLGQDSIEKGELAAYVGSIMVIVFMLLTYRLFGVFANIAVAINVAMIFGMLSLLNATLTLPGIAGIVLTVGIAVDSNVLIYERIREELRGGRNAISAIDAGFRRALSTILDSNITTFIAAAVLFYIGTGPVRGFAVTLGIGIITTVFTAFTLTSLIVAGWVRWKRPKTVPI